MVGDFDDGAAVDEPREAGGDNAGGRKVTMEAEQLLGAPPHFGGVRAVLDQQRAGVQLPLMPVALAEAGWRRVIAHPVKATAPLFECGWTILDRDIKRQTYVVLRGMPSWFRRDMRAGRF